jgi:hypothetical protein
MGAAFKASGAEAFGSALKWLTTPSLTGLVEPTAEALGGLDLFISTPKHDARKQ